jgi:hypothetical protein
MTTTATNLNSRAARTACYHAVRGVEGRRYGRRVTVLIIARRGVHPRNVLIQFDDGTLVVTSIGCLRWKCQKHEIEARK